MKKYITSIAVAMLFIGIVAALYAKAHSTYTVQNNTNFNIGNVTLNLQTGNPVIVNVTGTGSFNADISSDVASVVINNNTAAIGTTTNLTTANGDKVDCTPCTSGPVLLIN